MVTVKNIKILMGGTKQSSRETSQPKGQAVKDCTVRYTLAKFKTRNAVAVATVVMLQKYFQLLFLQ